MVKPIKKEKIIKALTQVMDPELDISIYDLGLVYDCRIKNNIVMLTMTLTTIGCPLFSVIEADVKNAVMAINGVKDVKIKLVFDPPWDIDKMTPVGRAVLGL